MTGITDIQGIKHQAFFSLQLPCPSPYKARIFGLYRKGCRLNTLYGWQPSRLARPKEGSSPDLLPIQVVELQQRAPHKHGVPRLELIHHGCV